MKQLINYQPKDKYEEQDKTYMLELYNKHGIKLFSRFKFFHFTASAVVFNEDYSKVLFIYHKIYDSWGWMGGHMDGLTDFYEVAKKEVFEESGLKEMKLIFNEPISIEVLPVSSHTKNDVFVSAHEHLNLTYAFFANEKSLLTVNKDETKGVKWLEIDKLESFVTEEKMLPIYKKIIKRIKGEY